jgi:hypothetical protein
MNQPPRAATYWARGGPGICISFNGVELRSGCNPQRTSSLAPFYCSVYYSSGGLTPWVMQDTTNDRHGALTWDQKIRLGVGFEGSFQGV